MRRSDGITDSMDISLSKLQNMLKKEEAVCAAVHRVKSTEHNLVTEQQLRALKANAFAEVSNGR